MEEQAFYKTIDSFVGDLHDNCFGVGILYDMCSDKLHPWGHKNRLGDKLYFISKLHDLTIRESFLRYDVHEVDGKERSRHRKVNVFGAIRDMLVDSKQYKAFVEKISGINWQFAFDGGSDDILHFKESLNYVLEFNDILLDVIESYDKLYNQQCTRQDNIPFVSKFLHFHRPEQFFMYDRDLSSGRIYFYSQNGCRIAEAIIDDEAKSKIEGTYQKILKAMIDDNVLTDEPPDSEKVRYICTMGLQYAICCYIKENSDKIGGLNQHPFTFIAAEILTHVRKVKSSYEIKEIIEKLKPESAITELALYCEDIVEVNQIAEAYMRRNNKQ